MLAFGTEPLRRKASRKLVKRIVQVTLSQYISFGELTHNRCTILLMLRVYVFFYVSTLPKYVLIVVVDEKALNPDKRRRLAIGPEQNRAFE
jgi:hypothetical protein